MKCPRCGKDAITVTSVFCSHCGAQLSTGTTDVFSSTLTSECPAWETDLRVTAPFRTLLQTFNETLFYPDRFFNKAAAKKCPVTPAWIFGLIAGSIGLLASWTWSMLFLNYSSPFALSNLFFSRELASPYMLIVAPVLLSLQFLFAAMYVQIMMYFGRFNRPPLSQTFRILCYAECPMILQIIPVIGTIAGSILWAYAVLTGLHHLYGANRIKVLFFLLLPFVMLTALLIIIVVAGILGGIIAGTGFLKEWQPLIDPF